MRDMHWTYQIICTLLLIFMLPVLLAGCAVQWLIDRRRKSMR